DPDLTTDVSVITFNSFTWNIPQTVTISAAEDVDLVNGNSNFILQATNHALVSIFVREIDDDLPAGDEPGTPLLSSLSDTGVGGDDITNLNNSSSRKISFIVPNTIVGATIKLYADGIVIGSAVASTTTTTILTSGQKTLTDGEHEITATQTEPSHLESGHSNTLTITIDATRTYVTINRANGQTDPTNSSPINFTVTLSEAAEELSADLIVL